MKIKNWKFKIKRGFGIVEAVVAISIAAFSILFIWKIYNSFVELSLSNPQFFQASFLAEEGIEAVKWMRDDNWAGNIASLTPGTSYFVVLEGGRWVATTTPSVIDNQFERKIVLNSVNRNVTGSIAESGTLDPGTRKVTVTVAWSKNFSTSTRQIETYVTNIFNN